MKTIFKYIFASVFTGLCAAFYQSTKRQNVSVPNSSQSTEIIAPVAPDLAKDTGNTLALRAQARQERILLSEQQALQRANTELSTIVPVYQVIDQPVGHTPAPVVQEVVTVALQPKETTAASQSGNQSQKQSIPFPVSSVSDRSSVMSNPSQLPVPSNQAYDNHDTMFYPEQQVQYPSMQHNISDMNMDSMPEQIDHESSQPLAESPRTMQKVINSQQPAGEQDSREGRFMARKHRTHRPVSTTRSPMMSDYQSAPQGAEEMIQDDTTDGQSYIAAPVSWMSYFKNGLGFLGTAALACPSAALGYLGSIANRFGNMFRGGTPAIASETVPLALTNGQTIGQRAIALTQRAGAAVSSTASTLGVAASETTSAIGTSTLSRFIPTWSQLGYAAAGIAAMSAAVYGACRFNAYRSNTTANDMMMSKVSQSFNQYVSSSAAGSSSTALAGATPAAQGWLAAGFQSIAAQFARLGATGQLR